MRSILHCPLSEVLLIHTKLWKRCYIPKHHIYKVYRTQRTVCRYWKSTDCSRAGGRVVKCTGLSKMRSSKKKYIMWVASIWRKFLSQLYHTGLITISEILQTQWQSIVRITRMLEYNIWQFFVMLVGLFCFIFLYYFRSHLAFPGDCGSTVVKVLCYKSEDHWFDPSWCQWIFHWHKVLLIALWPWGRLSL